MMQKLRDALIFYIALGVYLLITIFLATLFFGWTGDCVVDSLRYRALSNMLNQDAAYFDVPSRSTAITVTRCRPIRSYIQLSIEIVEQARTIQLLTREEHFCKLFDEKLDHALKLQKRSGPSEAINFAITMAFPYISDTVTYGFGISLIYYAHAAPDTVFA
ncbi:Multidrug resistance protein 1 [Toxocara canis]|uniref:Multidrug resistance protein 1 n=1 Tax=Toxocara canis TaxID=6265 RepID=A0A0B2VSE1_TOXCA|nr:Multidrug resistance protein 1 [Toxocara canis]